MNLLLTLLPSLLFAGEFPAAAPAAAPIAAVCECVAPLPTATLSLNISPNQTMTVTGGGYPANTTVTITLKNLNTGNSVTVNKTTDANGTLQPGGTSLGTLTATAGDVIQASTPAPNEATTTAVVPETPPHVDPDAIGRIIRFIIRLLP